MKTMKAAKCTLAMLCAIVAASFALVGSAYADAVQVHGADFYGTGSALESGEIDVLNVDGKAGDVVFLTVIQGTATVAKNIPYTIGADATAGDEASWAGVATLDISTLVLDNLKRGDYTIEAYDKRAGGECLYSGKLYGVYAKIPGAEDKLIGTRTVNDSEKAARTFNAPATLYDGGRTFRLASGPEGDGALAFAYEEYDEATTIDGVVNYLDAQGNVIASSEIPGMKYGEERKVDVPNVVVADNGDLYRTVFFKDSITAKNPGAVSFGIYCTKISDADKALAGYFVAVIKMVDESGSVIATDSVNVTGDFVYTAPSTIYKKETNTSIGQPAVVTYDVKGSPTIFLSAAANKEGARVQTVTVEYATTDPDQPSADVTFNLIDGSKRIGEAGRKLGSQVVTVTLDSPTAVPQSTVEADGATYNIVGDPTEYAYTLRSGEVPSVNVYYVPEGYEPPGPYDVTVNYVNFLTDEVVESHTYSSDPNTTGALTIETPATFTSGGVEYIRLDGQEADIEHSYYSGIVSYTVYYRDKNDTLTSGTVINTIRVVYRDGGTTATTGGTAGGGVTAGGVAVGGATAGGATAGGAAAAGGDAGADAADNGTQNMQLNDGRTYNVFDGDGNNGTLTNESGVDSNTERIEDSETPLASGFDKGGSSSAASSLSGLMLPIGIGIVIAIAIAAAFMAIRRRKNDEANEA